MQSFLLKASSKAQAASAVSAIRAALVGRRCDITSPESTYDTITPSVMGEDENGLKFETKPGVYSPVYFKAEIVLHDDDAPPSWPKGVTVTPLVESSFAFAPKQTVPTPRMDGEAVVEFTPLDRRQLLLGLLGLGKTEQEVLAVIAAIPDKMQSEVMRIWFENPPPNIHRNNDKVVGLIAAMGLDAALVDAGWKKAALL